MKIYLAAPLFNAMEIQRNESYTEILEQAGFEVFLPQRDAGEISSLADCVDCFNKDVSAIINCNVVVALCDGRTQDEGTCWEMGYAFAKGKPVIIISSDRRYFTEKLYLNNMLLQSASRVFSTLAEVVVYLRKLKEGYMGNLMERFNELVAEYACGSDDTRITFLREDFGALVRQMAEEIKENG